MNAMSETSLGARATTPAPILAGLRKEFNAATASEGYARSLETHAIEVVPIAPDASAAFLAGERKLWSDAVNAAGVVID